MYVQKVCPLPCVTQGFLDYVHVLLGNMLKGVQFTSTVVCCVNGLDFSTVITDNPVTASPLFFSERKCLYWTFF